MNGAERKTKGIFNPDFWRQVGYGIVIGMILMLLFLGGCHYANSSLFCGSCHSMTQVYHKWQVSRYKQFACIECHMPVGNIVMKFSYKTTAGLNSLFHETIRSYPAVIRLSVGARTIANDNYLRYHFSTEENTPMAKSVQSYIKCHRYLVHGRGPEKEGLCLE